MIVTVTYYVPKTGYVMSYVKSTVYGTVTSQYVANVPTTLFSTSASTSTFATSQVVAVTATQTLTSVSEQAGRSISDMLSRNLWIILVLGVVVLVVLAFMLGRRRGTGQRGVVSTSTDRSRTRIWDSVLTELWNPESCRQRILGQVRGKTVIV